MTKTEFQKLVDRAKQMTKLRLAKTPSYGVFIHADEQIAFIQMVLNRSEQLPTAAELATIDVGLMAAKELEDTDAEYARVLEEVDYYFSTLS